jgi:hypothetical protein
MARGTSRGGRITAECDVMISVSMRMASATMPSLRTAPSRCRLPELKAEIVRLHFASTGASGPSRRSLACTATWSGLYSASDKRRRWRSNARAWWIRIATSIAQTLARYPRLRATRLYDMLCERGYKGAVRTLRQYVAEVRPQPRREV